MTKKEYIKDYCSHCIKCDGSDYHREFCPEPDIIDSVWEACTDNAIEKAVELYKAEIQQCKNMLNYFKANAGDIIDLERSVDIFRKAMIKSV